VRQAVGAVARQFIERQPEHFRLAVAEQPRELAVGEPHPAIGCLRDTDRHRLQQRTAACECLLHLLDRRAPRREVLQHQHVAARPFSGRPCAYGQPHPQRAAVAADQAAVAFGRRHGAARQLCAHAQAGVDLVRMQQPRRIAPDQIGA
jgi:hypothetical protein